MCKVTIDIKYLFEGFPSSVSTVSDVASIAAQFIWTMAVKHSAMNGNAVSNFFTVYPFSPGKVGKYDTKEKK